jgi:hypothetical protein
MGRKGPRKRAYRTSDAKRLLRKVLEEKREALEEKREVMKEKREADDRATRLQSILDVICETLDLDVPETREQAVAALRDLVEGHRGHVAATQR